MTTDTELRDLLAAEAGGPADASRGWDDVIRRGRHRQRVRRAQNLALVAVAAGVTFTAVTLSTDDTEVETTPPVDQPAPTTTEATDPPAAQPRGARLYAARTDGTTVKLFFGRPPGISDLPTLCSELRPVITESAERVTVGLVDEQDARAGSWAECTDSPSNDSGTVELSAPAGDRQIVDAASGEPVVVTDSALLLFPTSLPAPFDIEVFEESNRLAVPMSPPTESTSFVFTAEKLQTLWLTSSGRLDANGNGCDEGRVVEVRGTEGCFSADEGVTIVEGEEIEPGGPPGGVYGSLSWDEDGRALSLTVDMLGAGASARDELLTIAETLEPLSD